MRPEKQKPRDERDRGEKKPSEREDETESEQEKKRPEEESSKTVVLRVRGAVTPEVWDKLGVRLRPKLRNGKQLRLGLDFECEFPSEDANAIQTELRQAVADLRLAGQLQVDCEQPD